MLSSDLETSGVWLDLSAIGETNVSVYGPAIGPILPDNYPNTNTNPNPNPHPAIPTNLNLNLSLFFAQNLRRSQIISVQQMKYKEASDFPCLSGR